MTEQPKAMNQIEKIVIIGAGQAAAQSIVSLRQGGFEGAITLIGEEPVPPYQRPPLSKAYMKGEFTEERLFFRAAAWYEDNNVDLMLSMKACLLYTSPSPRDLSTSRMPSSA